jgi:hypothetical protein
MKSTKEIPQNPEDAEKVKNYMEKLVHPLKAEIEAVRKIIKTNKNISERMKLDDPSYFYKEDLMTFNLHNQRLVHLVFHNPAIVNIESDLLEHGYRENRMVYFDSMKSIKDNKKELMNIFDKLVKQINKKYD